MKNILTFFRERVPFIQYFLLVSAFLSVGFTQFDILKFLTGFLSMYLFFALLRLMDDVKDYDKDIVANQNRPLPRGLLSLIQARDVVKIMLFLSFGVGGVLVLQSQVAGYLYLFIVFYLFLMYKEFYVGEKLASSPILYATTHQIIVVPLVLFCYFIQSPPTSLSELRFDVNFEVFLHSVVCLAGFFQYEILRKMNPNAHKILGQYLTFYGFKTIVFIVVTLIFLGLLCSLLNGSVFVVLVANLLVLFSLWRQAKNPDNYKMTEAIASISLILHLISYFVFGALFL